MSFIAFGYPVGKQGNPNCQESDCDPARYIQSPLFSIVPGVPVRVLDQDVFDGQERSDTTNVGFVVEAEEGGIWDKVAVAAVQTVCVDRHAIANYPNFLTIEIPTVPVAIGYCGHVIEPD